MIISAKTGEFESGFEKSGQTVEHVKLAKSLGVDILVVIVNKMELTNWSLKRYSKI